MLVTEELEDAKVEWEMFVTEEIEDIGDWEELVEAAIFVPEELDDTKVTIRSDLL